MALTEQQREWLGAHLQGDAPAREAAFAEFAAMLAKLAKEGAADEASIWAAHAASPLLEYTSLMRLHRLVLPRPLPQKQEAEKGGSGGKAGVLRLAILGGPTTTQLRQLIEVFLAGEGIAADIYEADFGLFRHEVLTAGSALDTFRPQVVFLATSARDVARRPALAHDEKEVMRLAEQEFADWSRLWETANARWGATIIQNNFEIGHESVLGHFSLRHPASREHYVERLNRLLAERAPSYVIIHNLRGLAAEAGGRQWFESRFYHDSKMPCGPDSLVTYAYSVVSLLRALVGKSKKVVVLDLDNTLWGGVVGDLGAGGIHLGQGSGEGEAYLAFQQYLKGLQSRGILLAVCSKNDEKNAREPFERRGDMVLKLADISCFIANWQNKADNLREIAGRLELKLDSLVFVDDNPAERSLVRRFTPEVATPDMPEDPAGYIQAVALHRYFETVAFTREDASRAQFYAQNALRQEMAAKSVDLPSFLTSLDMRMKVEPINDLNIERATQLINKSNQFNLTTKRYTLAQIRDIAAAVDWRTLTFSLRDNLGDNGLISVILMRIENTALAIDTWVMSCRVLQRGVEQMTRNEIVDLARREKLASVRGTYIPTAKNSMVKDHYQGLGFETQWPKRPPAT